MSWILDTVSLRKQRLEKGQTWGDETKIQGTKDTQSLWNEVNLTDSLTSFSIFAVSLPASNVSEHTYMGDMWKIYDNVNIYCLFKQVYNLNSFHLLSEISMMDHSLNVFICITFLESCFKKHCEVGISPALKMIPKLREDKPVPMVIM